jgi:hypothetical protein
MKKTNIFKLIGIIAFIAIIGFSMAGCPIADEPKPEPEPETEDTPPTTDPILFGTWYGYGTCTYDDGGGSGSRTLPYGTLTIDGETWTSPESYSQSIAGNLAVGMTGVYTMQANGSITDLTVKDGEVKAKVNGDEVVQYKYTVENDKLTIINMSFPSVTYFVGIKITIDPVLNGKWVSDDKETYGTLIIDNGSWTSPDKYTDILYAPMSVSIVSALNDTFKDYAEGKIADLTIKDGEIKYTSKNNGNEILVYKYKVENNTLTITFGQIPGVTAFTGVKIITDPILFGTWVGVADGTFTLTVGGITIVYPYGTLIIDGDSWTSTTTGTTANYIVDGMDLLFEGQADGDYTDLTIKDGEVNAYTKAEKKSTYYKYKVEGNTLTIMDMGFSTTVPYFVGTKQ